MRVAVDTNVLVYAEGVNGATRQDDAWEILRNLRGNEVLLPTQVIGELFVVLTRKAKWIGSDAQRAAAGWAEAYEVLGTAPDVVADTMDVVVRHRLAFWDAVILAAAASARCSILLSEDMGDGFAWRGVTVRNPFAADFRL